MTKIYIDVRPSQLLDRKQRGTGIYTKLLIDHIKNLRKNDIYFYSLPIKFENYIKEYDPEKRTNVFIRKIQLLYWLLDNKLMNYKIPSGSIFHSLDQFHIPSSGQYKRVVTVHDLIPLLFPKEYLNDLNPIMKKIYLQSIYQLPYVDHIIAVSQFTKQDIIKNFSIDKSKISVIYEAADPKYKVIKRETSKNILNEKFNLPPNFILYVGGIDPRKNIQTVIKVFKTLLNEFSDLYLVIVGSDFSTREDPEKNRIDNLIKKFSLDKKIIPLGFISTDLLTCVYNEAKMLIFPSLYEGFGLPVIEAMACGCPVIASNRASIPEIAGGATILIDPENIEEITKAAKSLLNNKYRTQSLVKKGIKRSQKFFWKQTAKQTIEVYSNLAHSK